MKVLTTVIPIEGMRCSGCSQTIEKKIRQVPGVEWVSVNFAAQKAFVKGNASVASMIKAIEEAGYKTVSDKIKSPELEKTKFQRQKREVLASLLFSFPVFVLSMVHISKSWSPWAQLVFTLPVLYLGRSFFVGALRNLKHRTSNMDTLVALGTGSAFLYSCLGLYFNWEHFYFESTAVVISLVLLGRALEQSAKQKSSTALSELMTLTPQTVTLSSKKGTLTAETEISISQLQIGDKFLVRPGEVVATDGKVIEGISSVDESKLTGENAPKEKLAGSPVFGGTLNQNGRLVVEASTLGEETRLSKLIRSVEEAQGSKTEVQRLADKVSAIFVPAVLIIASLTFGGWLLTGSPVWKALLPAISVLVIACPCALGLATPTALITGIGRAAQLGVLIRDARSLEETHKIDIILLDKTGTLTEGIPKVTESYFCSTGKSDLRLIAAIESQASHPFARAVSQFAKSFSEEDKEDFQIEQFQNIPGQGCSGKVNGKMVCVGSRPWVESQGVNTVVDWLPHAELERIKKEGKSRVWAAVDNHLACVLIIYDSLRPEAKQSISELGLEARVKILSGDNADAVEKVANELGVTEWLSDVTPIQKAEEVKRLKAQGFKVAMVGDGVNDGPALALADVSVTLASGTDLAKEVASITLLHGDLRQVLLALKMSHQVMRVISQNLFAAFFYNTVSIPIAALGLLNPMVAGFAMAMSSVSVVLNSLRLKGLMGPKNN